MVHTLALNTFHVDFVVSQGSVISPPGLVGLYTTSFSQVITNLNINHILHANTYTRMHTCIYTQQDVN